MDQRNADHDQRATDQLRAGRQLAEQQPGNQHREDDLGQTDERGELWTEQAGRADTCDIGDRRGDERQPKGRNNGEGPYSSSFSGAISFSRFSCAASSWSNKDSTRRRPDAQC
jgi:hypothetical protein